MILESLEQMTFVALEKLEFETIISPPSEICIRIELLHLDAVNYDILTFVIVRNYIIMLSLMFFFYTAISAKLALLIVTWQLENSNTAFPSTLLTRSLMFILSKFTCDNIELMKGPLKFVISMSLRFAVASDVRDIKCIFGEVTLLILKF